MSRWIQPSMISEASELRRQHQDDAREPSQKP